VEGRRARRARRAARAARSRGGGVARRAVAHGKARICPRALASRALRPARHGRSGPGCRDGCAVTRSAGASRGCESWRPRGWASPGRARHTGPNVPIVRMEPQPVGFSTPHSSTPTRPIVDGGGPRCRDRAWASVTSCARDRRLACPLKWTGASHRDETRAGAAARPRPSR
jgi:hypothetical protein